MTIGEKITILRNASSMSQEFLAEKLEVSRQSVSKWEMNQATPQLDKILQLCELFHISSDELIFNQVELTKTRLGQHGQLHYFGTDGFRGEANMNLTSMQAYKVGRFLGWYFSSSLSGSKKSIGRPRIVIGKDTRRSSYMLEYSIVAGITASGADAYLLHVTTTPSVSYVTRQDNFDCGIMITASHNPFYDNGIKVINRFGEKMDDETTSLIEAYLDHDMNFLGILGDDLPLAHRDQIGCIIDYVAGRNRYVGYLISVASHSYKHLRIGLDCANGSSWMIAKAIFDALGAQTVIIGNQPDGLNVNLSCGSTHVEALSNLVREHHLDAGFAFDGDADRCIAVDELGNVIDGDCIMFVLANRLKSRGMLNRNTVVATVMSNSGFVRSLKNCGIDCEMTKVGDRFVYESMQEHDYSLGGEESGHIILKKYATTGDGLLTAIMIMEEMCDRKSSLSSLCADVHLFPQYLVNLRVSDQEAVLHDAEVLEKVHFIENEINGSGRVLLRKSGTEPVVRIMVECESMELCQSFANQIALVVREKGYCNG